MQLGAAHHLTADAYNCVEGSEIGSGLSQCQLESYNFGQVMDPLEVFYSWLMGLSFEDVKGLYMNMLRTWGGSWGIKLSD